MCAWAVKEGSVGKRVLPPRKSCEAIIASLMADGIMTEDDIAELVAQAAVDEARASMRKQRQPTSATKPAKQSAPPPPAPLAPHTPPPPAPSPPAAKDPYRIRNWKAYNQALIQRGSLTIWLDQTSIQSWKNDTPNRLPGRDLTYTDIAILTMLTLKAVFHLPLRATQGLTASIMRLAQIMLPIPNYTTLSCRSKTLSMPLPVERREARHVVIDSSGLKIYGEGEWKVRQHGWSKRRTWRKIHLGIDETTQEVVACVVTEHHIADCEALPQLLEQIIDPLTQVSADGSYDTADVYGAILDRGATPVIPPRENAVVNTGPEWAARTTTVARVGEIGPAAWKVEAGYHRRSLAETAMVRLKTLFGDHLSSRSKEGQQTEGAIRCAALNRMTRLGLPDSCKVVAG
jgi:hypothetical protein